MTLKKALSSAIFAQKVCSFPKTAAMMSLSYSQRGMSFLLQAKRSENMSFRSDRTGSGIGGFINHMPAFSMTHTYALAAMYPYATQYGTYNLTSKNPGEWAFQAEARYTFKRKTPMGGKYGTSFRLNGTYIRGIKVDPVAVNATGTLQGTNGYTSPFFAMGDETYYLDVHLEFAKKFTKTFSMTALYMFQQYNQTVVEGHYWDPAEEKDPITNEPLYDFATLDKKGHFIVADNYVTMSDGTGIVHIAPAFGEDDNKVGRKYDLPFVQLVCEDGQWYIQDKSAQHTTFIYAGEKTALKDGDVILMGNRQFIFHID